MFRTLILIYFVLVACKRDPSDIGKIVYYKTYECTLYIPQKIGKVMIQQCYQRECFIIKEQVGTYFWNDITLYKRKCSE